VSAWILVALLTAIGVSGIVIGRAWERRAWVRARPGYLIPPTPKAVHDHWAFPQAPVYDQEADTPAHHETGYKPDKLTPPATMTASVGHPLIPDARLLGPEAAHVAEALDRLDPHSRKVKP
jgi:hypothetical protein